MIIFRIQLTILHAKFCTDCSLSIFNFEQLAYTFEQKKNLLKTKVFITMRRVLLSNACLTRKNDGKRIFCRQSCSKLPVKRDQTCLDGTNKPRSN